jgi:hypothetical protein
MAIEIKALDTVAEAAKDFLQKVITPPLEEVGSLLSDQVKLWRFKNQVNIVNKAEAYLKSKNIKSRKVSIKVLTPLLENASIEEDSTLQEKWAQLLANTVREDSSLDTTLYSHILSQMTATDATLFDFFNSHLVLEQASEFIEVTPSHPPRLIFKYSDLEKKYKGALLSIDNLIRLRLIIDLNPVPSDIDFAEISISNLGFTFKVACEFQ